MSLVYFDQHTHPGAGQNIQHIFNWISFRTKGSYCELDKCVSSFWMVVLWPEHLTNIPDFRCKKRLEIFQNQEHLEHQYGNSKLRLF
jgi:hypothetical protein